MRTLTLNEIKQSDFVINKILEENQFALTTKNKEGSLDILYEPNPFYIF